MDCSHFRLKVSPYLDYELSFAEQKMFTQHGEACPECAEMLTRMEGLKLTLRQGVPTSLSPDFVSRLQERLRHEKNRQPSWWRQLTTPQSFGLSPVSLGGMAVATLAVLFLGVSLFQQESAPLVDPPRTSIQAGQPAMMVPNATGVDPASTPLLTTMPADSVSNRRDSSRRDFSRQMKYVNQNR